MRIAPTSRMTNPSCNTKQNGKHQKQIKENKETNLKFIQINIYHIKLIKNLKKNLYSSSFLTTVHLDTGKSNKGLYVYMFKVFFGGTLA